MNSELKSLLSNKNFVLELLKDPQSALKAKGIVLSEEQLTQLQKDADRHLFSFSKTVLYNSQIQNTAKDWTDCPS